LLAARNKLVRRGGSHARFEPRVRFPVLPRFRRVKSNFRMAESKIGMLSMRHHNKIALSLGAGGAILQIK
jgi:hypothetical protein